MGHRIYVGNLSYDTHAEGLRGLFESSGHTVTDIHIVTDRETGRSRGFAFVEVETPEMLSAAISGLDGQELDGRRISVSEARPRAPREGGPGGPRGGGGGGPRSFDRRPGRGPGSPRPGPPVEERRRRFDGGGGGGGDFPPRRFGGERPPPAFDGGPPPWAAGGEDGGRRRKKWDRPEGGEGAGGDRRNAKRGAGRRDRARDDDDFDDW